MRKLVNIFLFSLIFLLSIAIAIMSIQLYNIEERQMPNPTSEPTITLASTIAPTFTPVPTEVPTATPIPEPEYLEIHQISIGCADAFMLRTKSTTIMIDGGLAKTKNRVINYLRDAGVEHIDAYIGTHNHTDHVENINEILELFGTSETIVFGPTPELFKKYQPLSNGKYVQMLDGNEYTVGDIHLFCVGPTNLVQNGNCNNDSLNFVVQLGKVKALFTGDYMRKDVIEKYPDLLKDIDIFKFPHHGLKNFSMKASSFKWLSPKYVLVPSNNGNTVKSWGKELGMPKFECFSSSGGKHHALVIKNDCVTVYDDVNPAEFAD